MVIKGYKHSFMIVKYLLNIYLRISNSHTRVKKGDCRHTLVIVVPRYPW